MYILFTGPSIKKIFCTSATLSLLLLLLREVGNARLGESDFHPIRPKTPAPQYQPIERKKRMGNSMEDKRERVA